MGFERPSVDLRTFHETNNNISAIVGIGLNLLLHFDYKGGNFYMMLTGPLQCLSPLTIDKLMAIWMFSLSLELTNVPVQFIYRYYVISKKQQPSVFQYSLLLFIGIVMSATYSAATYYVFYPNDSIIDEKIKLLKEDPYYFNEVPSFIVAEITNPSLQVLFGYNYIIVTVMYGIIIVSSWKVKNILKAQKSQLSIVTMDVHKQVKLTLLIQAIIPCAVCFVPITTAIAMTELRTNWPGLGIILAIFLSWMPAFNAIISMVLIRSYRRHLQKLFRCESKIVPTTPQEHSHYKP